MASYEMMIADAPMAHNRFQAGEYVTDTRSALVLSHEGVKGGDVWFSVLYDLNYPESANQMFFIDPIASIKYR